MGGNTSALAWQAAREASIIEIEKIFRDSFTSIRENKEDDLNSEALKEIFIQSNERYKDVLQKIWHEYDPKKRGYLNMKDARRMVQECLTETQTFLATLLPVVLPKTIDVIQELLRSSSTALDRQVTPEELSAAKRAVETSCEDTIQAYAEVVDRLLRRGSVFSDRLLSRIAASKKPAATATTIEHLKLREEDFLTRFHLVSEELLLDIAMNK